MNFHYKNIMLLTLGALTLTSCGPQKKEEAPATQPEEVQPSETQGLSPSQAEELKINEDNVMNPIPG
jgi:hypothetical protein